MSGKEPTMHNILEDLLGVKADRSVQAPAGQEVDELIKLTHRGRHLSAKESPSPGTASENAPISEEPAKPALSAAPQASYQPEPPTTQPEPPPPTKKTPSILALFAVLRLNNKNFQLEVKLPDFKRSFCSFKNGLLADDYWVSQDDGQEQADEDRSVLVVDADHAFVIEMAKGFAEYESRFLTLTAATGRQAVRILETKKIDLLVTGLKMPEMDGFELMSYMKAHFPAVPILAVSTFDFPAMHARVKQHGARQHFIKPVVPNDLAKFILEILGQQPGKKSVKGMPFADFITLLGLSNTSFFVDIFLQGRDHFLCRIEKGYIQGISYGPIKGESALREILTWNDFTITLRQSPV